MGERKRQKLEIKIRGIVEEEDISNILFLIDGASDFVYFLLEFELDDVDFSNVTFISTEKSFDLVYKFLLEKYPEKPYLFANVMSRDNKFKLISNDEQIRITKLLFQRLFYYLEDECNDLNGALNLLRKELKDEITSREYFDVSLEEIENFVKFVNIRYNYLSKSSIKQLAFKKLLSVNMIIILIIVLRMEW